MSKITKLQGSRNSWKEKALRRGSSLRDLKKINLRIRERINVADNALKAEKERREALEKEGLRLQMLPSVKPVESAEIRTISVLLVINAVVSFRSIPRILNFLPALCGKALSWIPDYTSVINWHLRVGVFLLERVTKICEPWVAIMDCSIDIGTRKALVILRVPMSVLSLTGKALSLKDCECLAIKIAHTWNGKTVAATLTDVFSLTGAPVAIIKDGGSDLKKGVNLWRKKSGSMRVLVIEDVGHVVANALKAVFAKCSIFKSFIEILSVGTARIRQTNLALFVPPKIRSKARFQSISKLGSWAESMLNILADKSTEISSEALEKLKKAFAGLLGLDFFITRFILLCRTVEEFQKILKNNGLNQATYAQAKIILEKLPEQSKIKATLLKWLQKHLSYQCRLGISQTPLCVSSDIIESLFGKFKSAIQRCPAAELGRTVLAIPTLCGNIDEKIIQQGLQNISHKKMQEWVKNNIPETLRSQKIKNTKFIKQMRNRGPIPGKAA